MSIIELAAARLQQAEEVTDLINELSLKFAELQASTQSMRQQLITAYRKNQGGSAVVYEPIGGLDNLDYRVKILILHRLFNEADGVSVDLIGITRAENQSALNLEAKNVNS